MNNWQPIETAPSGIVVMTKIDDIRGDRNVQKLRRRGKLWFCVDNWTGDDVMYVYYQPTHWRPLRGGE